jgi:uncharacterized protein YegL
MTDTDYTALLLVIDRSGSMTDIRDDMVGGLTTLLAEQVAQPGRLTVDLVTFDDEVERVCSLADPATVKIELIPRGMTALHDAVGRSVQEFGATLAKLAEDARPATVQVVVVTDGGENSSTEWTAATVRKIVSEQTDKYGWDFVFMGANQDAVFTGAELGFAAESSLTFAASGEAVDALTGSLSRYMSDVRGKTKRGFDTVERASAAR